MFCSLVYELSHPFIHGGALSELPDTDSLRTLHGVLQGWRHYTKGTLEPMFLPSPGSSNTTQMTDCNRINGHLALLLDRMYDMAHTEQIGVGAAMLLVIVSALRAFFFCLHSSCKILAYCDLTLQTGHTA